MDDREIHRDLSINDFACSIKSDLRNHIAGFPLCISMTADFVYHISPQLPVSHIPIGMTAQVEMHDIETAESAVDSWNDFILGWLKENPIMSGDHILLTISLHAAVKNYENISCRLIFKVSL